MILETEADTVLSGKTGWANAPDPMAGWFVGYEERGSDVYYFATEIDMKREADIPKRRSITLRTLAVLDDLSVR